MNNTTVDCNFDSSSGKQYLTKYQRFTLIATNSILSIANVFTNALVFNISVGKDKTIIELFNEIHAASFYFRYSYGSYGSNNSNPLIICAIRDSLFSLRFRNLLYSSDAKSFTIHYLNNRFRSIHPYTIRIKLPNNFNINSCLHFDDWSLCFECY